MAESKFTPGPLEAKENKWEKHPWEILAGDTYIRVAIENKTEAEAKANAELWADAPRMLEVLRKVLTYAESSTWRQYLDEADQTFVEANALLEKHGG